MATPRKFDLDAVVLRLECGETLTAIAKSLKLPRATLSLRIEKSGGSARVAAARKVAAAAYAEKAETVLNDATEPFELAKAKELAHHYRWTAKCFSPQEYGDKIQAEVDVTAQVTHVTRTIVKP